MEKAAGIPDDRFSVLDPGSGNDQRKASTRYDLTVRKNAKMLCCVKVTERRKERRNAVMCKCIRKKERMPREL